MIERSMKEMIQKATTPRVILWLCFATIALVGMMLYLNTLDNSFNFDDYSIYERTNLLKPGHLPELMKAEPRRFIPYLSFALNYQWEGLNVFGYHLVNMIIHIVNGLLVFWLVMLTLRRGGVSPPFSRGGPGNPAPTANDRYLFALSVALIFIAHPLQTAAVTYIVQRLASMASMFYLLSVCLYLSARTQPRINALFVIKLLLALASFGLGIYSKEIVYSLPAIVLAYELLFFQGGRTRQWISRHGWKIVTIALIWGIVVIHNIGIGRLLAPQESPTFETITSSMYFMTQLRVLMTYARLLVLPIGQNVDYDYPLVTGLAQAEVIFSLIGLLAVGIFTVWITRKNKWMGLGLIWMAITLAIESSFIPLKDVIFEHRLYLPMVGFAMFLVTLVFNVRGPVLRLPPKGGEGSPPLRAIILMTLIIVFSVLTIRRNDVWQDKLTLWSDTVKKSPYKARPYYNLGNALRDRGRYEEAVGMYSRSINLAPKFGGALLNRAIAYRELSRYGEALADVNRLIAQEPQNFKALRQREIILLKARQAKINGWGATDWEKMAPAEMFNRAGLLIDAGQYAQAIAVLDRYLKIKPDDAEAFNNRGFAKGANNDVLGALNDYNQALTLKPDLPLGYFNRGMIYQRLGNFEAAIYDYDRALAIDPKYVEAYNDRAIAFMKLKKWDEAIADFDRALAINPAFAPAKHNRQLAVNGKQGAP